MIHWLKIETLIDSLIENRNLNDEIMKQDDIEINTLQSQVISILEYWIAHQQPVMLLFV